jgi:selenocysteine-specific translation elongation factor
MDVKSLLVEAKARFQHNAARDYLKEKYKDKLIVADQGGLWKADSETIALLSSFDSETIIIVDTFSTPVEVNRVELLEKLKELYQSVSQEYLKEWKELEAKR